MSKELAKAQVGRIQPVSAFANMESFENTMRMAKLLNASTLVPEQYRGQQNISNAVLAIEVAQRVGTSPFMVMQNLDIIKGKPSWSSKYVIAALNSCGRFKPLRFIIEELGEKTVAYTYKYDGQTQTKNVKVNNRRCHVVTNDADGNELTGPPVTIEMAVLEGWYTKSGSKWQTMPELMLRYRAAKFFGNLYAPDILMGMDTADSVLDQVVEVVDTDYTDVTDTGSATDQLNAIVQQEEPTPQPEPTTTVIIETDDQPQPEPSTEEPTPPADDDDDDDDLI